MYLKNKMAMECIWIGDKPRMWKTRRFFVVVGMAAKAEEKEIDAMRDDGNGRR